MTQRSEGPSTPAQRRAVLDRIPEEQRDLREAIDRLLAEREELARRVAAYEDLVSGLDTLSSRLKQRVKEVEAENRLYTLRYIQTEAKASSLIGLAAASARLHETVNQRDVLETIREIVNCVIGSEEMATFLLSADGQVLELVDSMGIDPAPLTRIPLGVGAIGRAAQAGEVHFAPNGGGEPAGLSACVPLKLGARLIGAIAIFQVLPQKGSLAPGDLKILELLTTQAAMALYCASHHGEKVTSEVRA